MNIGQKQRVAAVRFYLYDRPLHPELFEIHHQRRIVKAAYEAQIWVTGCTHVIGVFREKKSLAEIIGSPHLMLPQRGMLSSRPSGARKITNSSRPTACTT